MGGLRPDFTIELDALRKGARLVCGIDEAGRGPPGSMQELAFGPPGSMQELASMAADDSARVTGWRHDGRAIRAEAPSRAPQMSEPPRDGSEAVVSEASSADPVHVESAESSAVEDE